MYFTVKVTDTATKHLDKSSFKLWRGIDAGIKESAEKTRDRMKSNIRSRFTSRTGRAERSVKMSGPWTTKRGEILARVGSFARGKGVTADTRADYYLKPHEYGKTIKPRRAAYLVVPQPDGSIRKVKSVRLPSRSWFRPAVKPQSILGSVLKHIRRSLSF